MRIVEVAFYLHSIVPNSYKVSTTYSSVRLGLAQLESVIPAF